MKVLLITYDNGSYIHQFQLGAAYIASALRDAGHDVTIYSQDVYHYPDIHITEYLNTNHFDVVALGIIAGYYQYRKLLGISGAINDASDRPFYVIGGHGPSPEPGYFLSVTGADAVVIGEGEATIVDLLHSLDDLSDVPGIAHMDGECIINPSRTQMDIDTIPYPAWDMFPIDYYSLLRLPGATNTDRCFPVLTSRGCKFSCSFCYRMMDGIRMRSPQSIVDEISILMEEYGITYIQFSDELLMVSSDRTLELCEAFRDMDFKWFCSGRLNYATPDVLSAMKGAGCVFINYGIESLDDDILRRMGKHLTVRQITSGIEATLAAGISPGLNVMFGNVGDTASSLDRIVQFLLRYDNQAQLRTIRPVTPYPGSQLYHYAIGNNLLGGPRDFYESKHVNSDLLSVNFTKYTDDEFHMLLHDANTILINNYYDAQRDKSLEAARRLYYDGDTNFRGFRQT